MSNASGCLLQVCAYLKKLEPIGPNGVHRRAVRLVPVWRDADIADMTGFADLAAAAASARATHPEVALALATLVQVEGSSYRQPGARLLVDAEGRVLAGAVSGGCLEGDIAARAGEVCARGEAIRLTYDLRADLETIWGFGAACDGVAHLLLEPLPDPSWLAEAERIRLARGNGSVVTVLTEMGGATAMLGEGHPASQCRRVMHPLVDAVAWSAIHDAITSAQRTDAFVHRACTESPHTLFVEPLTAPVALHCIGAGRGAEAFAAIAATLGWHVTILDHRPAVLDGLHLPPGVHRQIAPRDQSPGDILRTLAHDERTAVTLLTHRFDDDAAWLAAALPSPVGYVGVLGSRKRAAELLERVATTLDAHGTPLTPRMTHRLFAPIGLDLGGESPAAIALSAIAEIEAVMQGRPGGSLRDRQSPIHARTPTPQLMRDRIPSMPADDQERSARE